MKPNNVTNAVDQNSSLEADSRLATQDNFLSFKEPESRNTGSCPETNESIPHRHILSYTKHLTVSPMLSVW
jgi:hypothetical protein